MNTLRPQKPYVFHPPQYSTVLAPVLQQVCRLYLRHRFNVRRWTVSGAETVSRLADDGHAVLIAPNHADHADPSLLVRVARRHGMALHFMAAREGFERSPFSAWLLQKLGAFSVDREGADLSSIKTAMALLQEGRFPLVIFPEGEIYHHHEWLDSLNQGVATILLRATAKLPDGRRSFLVPAAIRLHHDDRVEETFSPRLSRLEERIAWKPRPAIPAVDRIYRLGGGLLALKEQEFLGQTYTGDFLERIVRLQLQLVEMVEAKHGVPGNADAVLPERIKTVRTAIRRELTDEDLDLSPSRRQELYDDLDTLFVAIQLYSYPGQYVREDPTVDRIAETIFKLEEDLLGETRYPAPRTAEVRFDEPIDVQRFLGERSLRPKTAVGPLTELLSERINAMLQ
ncbi:MAG: lysophospholipid acyltransferase family protein [Planctomycetota bacterium]